jgi:hypothetical protein
MKSTKSLSSAPSISFTFLPTHALTLAWRRRGRAGGVAVSELRRAARPCTPLAQGVPRRTPFFSAARPLRSRRPLFPPARRA